MLANTGLRMNLSANCISVSCSKPDRTVYRLQCRCPNINRNICPARIFLAGAYQSRRTGRSEFDIAWQIAELCVVDESTNVLASLVVP